MNIKQYFATFVLHELDLILSCVSFYLTADLFVLQKKSK